MAIDPRQRVWAVVPAAGSGARMNAGLPKQYLMVCGRTLAEHTLRALLAVSRIREVVVALAPGDPHWEDLPASLRRRVRVVDGGVERSASVLNGLAGFSGRPDDRDWVLVHDMARACIRANKIDEMIDALQDDETGGLLAVPVVDTLKRSGEDHRVVATVERARLWRAQTPQMFRYGLLRRALESAREFGRQVTDESAAVEALGLCPRLVPGSTDNIKITTPEDIALAEYYLSQRSGPGA